jgi:hypothetical protein
MRPARQRVRPGTHAVGAPPSEAVTRRDLVTRGTPGRWPGVPKERGADGYAEATLRLEMTASMMP